MRSDVGDRESEIHVDFHHQPRVVVRGVMPAQRVDERAVPHEPVFVDMTTQMHELIDEIHARGHAHEQPSDIWRRDKAQQRGHRNRHQDKNNQRIGREDRDAPILGVAKPHSSVKN